MVAELRPDEESDWAAITQVATLPGVGWTALFQSQAERLTPLMSGCLTTPLEHIGSTAIPGMPAKPIIDMLGVVHDYEAFDSVVREVERLGWSHAPEPGDDARK